MVILTGRNGSGKTHLLEAIKEGAVKSSLVPNTNTDVLLFDWNNIIPQDTGIFHPSQHQTKRSNWFMQIRAQQDKIFPTLQQQAISLGIPVKDCSSFRKLKDLNLNKLEEIFSDPVKANAVYTNLQNQIKTHGKNIFSQTQRNISDENFKKMAPLVANDRPELFLEPSEAKFFSDEKFLWGEVDPFQQAFGRLFSTYRELIHHNDRLEKYPPEEESDPKHLDESEFIAQHGEPPWDFVNKILEVCNLDFRVESPPMREISSYEPKLNKISADVEMRFRDLSSGEKVLMSFALCLYNASDNRQEKNFPKLLLLDEVDAPLHPSMVLSLLNTIQEVLVDGKDVSVILTTHSPSTVALAPEEALFEMNPAGPTVDKISTSRALSILTAGVPTLSVSFDGRRQVFVESKTDAFIYEKLYQCYKSYLESERSLIFIEVGKTDNSGGEQNSGCAQVERLVSTLSTNGNTSVFGLVDWDGHRTPTERMKVLSCGVRDGIESLVFDPVLLAATAIKENIQFCNEQGIILDSDRYIDIGNWDQNKWQTVVNRMQNIVLGEESDIAESIDIRYLNDIVLQVSKSYVHLDDHELEEKVISTFGFLRPKNNHAGGLMNHIISSVLLDYPELMPNDLLITFKNLLDTPV